MRFLAFCKESDVKMRFLQVVGIEKLVKMMKKRYQNEDAKKSKNRCQKGAQKLSFFMKNGPLGPPGAHSGHGLENRGARVATKAAF